MTFRQLLAFVGIGFLIMIILYFMGYIKPDKSKCKFIEFKDDTHDTQDK